MADFFAELKRRHIYRVAAAYVVVAWVLTQVIDVLSQVFELPRWIGQPAILLLAAGFPVALLVAWTVESKPHQVIASAVRSKSTAVDWTLMAALVAVIAIFAYQQLAPTPDARTAENQPPGDSTTSSGPAVSIAVLPFLSLSSDAEQEFFADGMTEEITSALAKVSGLMVIGRTSAFQFKGEKKDLRAIGQALGASHLIEGSVRKDGKRLRITAQLIRADSGGHLWAENYDRELTDVFAIQDDIAQAIAGALRVPLGLAPGQTLVSLRPKDEETYELFLRGRGAYRARRVEEAVRFLEQAVARDPNFAPSWRYLSNARNSDDLNRRLRGEEPKTYPESGETLARRIIALAPDSADGYAMLASLARGEGKRLEAMDLQKQALARDPDDAEVMNGIANDLWELGYLKEALAVHERLHVLEPLIPVYNYLRAEVLAANGMLDVAVRDWLAVRPNVTAGRRLLLSAYAQLGRFSDAIDILSQSGLSPSGGSLGQAREPFAEAQVDAAVQVLRAAANKTPPPAQLPDFEGDLAFLYAYTSTPERMLDTLNNQGPATSLRYVWWPVPSSVRKTERFKTLMRDAGFVDIWRMRGWPDLCRPLGADDFACE